MSDQVYIPKAGLNSVGNYQVSGIPYASASVTIPASGSSPLKISFPSVTKEIAIKNAGANQINIAFSLNGLMSSSNYIPIASLESFDAEIKVIDIYMVTNVTASSTAHVFAACTGIGRDMLPNNWSGSVGVG
jgi:hypothetical protein